MIWHYRQPRYSHTWLVVIPIGPDLIGNIICFFECHFCTHDAHVANDLRIVFHFGYVGLCEVCFCRFMCVSANKNLERFVVRVAHTKAANLVKASRFKLLYYDFPGHTVGLSGYYLAFATFTYPEASNERAAAIPFKAVDLAATLVLAERVWFLNFLASSPES
ncbi:hypothetical protein D9M73_105970 [compost metagenome]